MLLALIGFKTESKTHLWVHDDISRPFWPPRWLRASGDFDAVLRGRPVVGLRFFSSFLRPDYPSTETHVED